MATLIFFGIRSVIPTVPADRINGIRRLSTSVTKTQSIYYWIANAKPSFTHAWGAFSRRSGEQRPRRSTSHAESGGSAIAAFEVAIARHRPKWKKLGITVITQVKNTR